MPGGAIPTRDQRLIFRQLLPTGRIFGRELVRVGVAITGEVTTFQGEKGQPTHRPAARRGLEIERKEPAVPRTSRVGAAAQVCAEEPTCPIRLTCEDHQASPFSQFHEALRLAHHIYFVGRGPGDELVRTAARRSHQSRDVERRDRDAQ